jgi:hypothetical protein
MALLTAPVLTETEEIIRIGLPAAHPVWLRAGRQGHGVLALRPAFPTGTKTGTKRSIENLKFV